jgi:uncharacterized protein YciI
MHIVLLRFGPNKAQAPQWLAQHNQWLQAGLDDGAFVLAGSLEGGAGGLLLAVGEDRDGLMARLQRDPFVAQGVVNVEVLGVTPSRTAPALAALLSNAGKVAA